MAAAGLFLNKETKRKRDIARGEREKEIGRRKVGTGEVRVNMAPVDEQARIW